MNAYLQTSLLPLRRFGGFDDLQAQMDTWTRTVADRRHVRRIGAMGHGAARTWPTRTAPSSDSFYRLVKTRT